MSTIEPIADLHMHTNYSDGVASVDELIKEVLKTNIRTIAITDHDTAEAVGQAQASAEAVGIRIIPGIELSSLYKKVDVHILGYFFDPAHPELLDYCRRFQKERERRAIRMIEKLNSLGAGVSMERVYEVAGEGSIGRPHVARVLIESGFVRSFQEAFDRFLGDKRPANIPKFYISPGDAIDLIHRAGGVAVLAHPATMKDDSIIAHLVKLGLDGLEVYHSYHRLLSCSDFYLKLAEKHGLLISGGSDWHGPINPDLWIGKGYVTLDVVAQLEAAASRYQS